MLHPPNTSMIEGAESSEASVHFNQSTIRHILENTMYRPIKKAAMFEIVL
jgi:hypothetical protein